MPKNMLEILRELREDHDLTQAKLAPKLGIIPRMYSRYETGVHALPLKVAVKLADFYNVSLDYITRRTDNMSGVDSLNQRVLPDYSVGELIDGILTLDIEDRKDIVKLINLMKNKK